MIYHTIFSKIIDYYDIAYSMEACMTTNKDILVSWYVYGQNGTPNPRSWVYLISMDGTILSSIENSTIYYNGIMNYYDHTFLQTTLYDDGTYLYSSSKKINKTTLEVTAESNDYITHISTDFTYGIKGRNVYSWPEHEKIYEMPLHYSPDIAFAEGLSGSDTSVVKIGDKYINQGRFNNRIIDGSYNWELGSMTDYDILLIGPSYCGGSYIKGQFIYVVSRDFNITENSGPISQEEYDEINAIAEDVLGGVE
jgi:hypothetical protein